MGVLAKSYVSLESKLVIPRTGQFGRGVQFDMGCCPNHIVQIKLAEFKATQVRDTIYRGVLRKLYTAQVQKGEI